MNVVRRFVLVLAALLSVGWLALLTGLPWISAPATMNAMAEKRGKDALTQFNDAHVDKSAVAQATTGRAIFRSSYQVPDKMVDEVGRYELRGIFERGGVTKASIRDTKRKKTLIKATGERLGDYEIVEVTAKGVRLRRGNEEVSLVR